MGDIHSKCNSLRATYRQPSGMIRCAQLFSFYLKNTESEIEVRICDECIRIIKLSCQTEIEATYLYEQLMLIERLLHILEEAFMQLEEISLVGHETDNTYRVLCNHFMRQRLHYFKTSDILVAGKDGFLNYESVLSSDLIKGWGNALEELGTVNQMYLYATTDCGFTKDVRCAFLIELAEPLIEWVGRENIKSCKNIDCADLKSCLRCLIQEYGDVIFEKEKNYDIEKILKCLVNTRVNIMHIKMKQRMPAFNGEEAVLYMIKMSYLYRIIVLNKLGIDSKLYIERVASSISNVNEWNGVLQKLFNRLL